MRKKLQEALNEISDEHIAQAAKPKKRKPVWLGAVAAILVLAILLLAPGRPMAISAQAISLSDGSRKPERPDWDDYADYETFRADLDAYDAVLVGWETDANRALDTLAPFFTQTSAAYLGNSEGTNRVWSPVNAFIALAALAEITAGDSRQQILDALGAADVETLRAFVQGLWEESYYDNGNEIRTLASSLWLNEDLNYEQAALDALSQYHYTSVYRADLQTSKASKALSAWINNNTGGLLKNNADQAGFPPEAVLTLVSTVYFQAKWSDQFNPVKNTQDIFHAPSGDKTVTFMNRKEIETDYYWGDSFGMTGLWLKNNSKMWLILPDADKTVEDVLNEGQYLDYIRPSEDDDSYSKYMKVNLSMPKFDVASSGNIAELFQGLGITDVFDLQTANFTAITADSPVFLTGANQAARVIVDEEGVKAASYIEFPGAGAAPPPEEVIDFVLDRPFIFVIADASGIPLFTGVVNEP